MEKLRKLLGEARDKLNTADHLTYVTYPAIDDVKMLYAITEGLFVAARNAMKAIVQYDRMYKRVPLVPGDFRSEFEIFKSRCAVRYGIDRIYVELIEELNRVVELRKTSPMEFVRRDKLVICTENYKMKVINLAKVKDYLKLSKGLVGHASRIIKC
ncbi:MAG: hypothetical protein ABIH76_07935 [Candidatus Bathyarchaeota archaeon]